MEERWAIEATGLGKSYGSTIVLDDLTLRVAAGTVFALLGPNGAGKTTTVRILATLTGADTGTVRVAGFDAVSQRTQVRRRISLTGQYAAVDGTQTGAENLTMAARLAGHSRRVARTTAAQLLERFDLTQSGTRRVSTYSGGMQRRLDLAMSLVGSPAIVFLDEPTTGLDPRSRQAMWDVVSELVGSGVTVFLTTQYLDEADRLADRIAVVDHGRIIAEGTATQLKQQVAEQRLELVAAGADAFALLRSTAASRTVYVDESARTIGLATDGTAHQIRALLDEFDPQSSLVERFAVRTATLDDVFLALTASHDTNDREYADVR